MDRIVLYLSQHKLYRVVFEHQHLEGPIISVRGKAPRGVDAVTNFQWTSAVQALTVLLLYRAQTELRAQSVISLEGGRNSLAASLDYALGRKPVWIREMFGITKKKKLMFRALFDRVNPEQRAPGPVAVQLRYQAWKNIAVKVHHNGKLVTEGSELNLIAQGIISKTTPASENGGSNPVAPVIDSNFGYDELRTFLRPGYHKAIFESLTSINVFDDKSVRRCVTDFMNNPSLAYYAGKHTAQFARLMRPRLTTARLGLEAQQQPLIDVVNQAGEISVAASMVFPASIAIFCYLKYWRGLNIKILDHFPHAVEVSARLARGDFTVLPDLVMMGLGPAATLLTCPTGKDYTPFLLLPRGALSVLRPRTASVVERYTLLSDPSSSSFLRDNLKRDFGFKAEWRHEEADGAIQRLCAGESEGALLMFPYSYVAQQRAPVDTVAIPAGAIPSDYVLFATKELLAKPALSNALENLIQDAWLELIVDSVKRHAVVEKMLADENHLRSMMRCSGLYREWFQT